MCHMSQVESQERYVARPNSHQNITGASRFSPKVTNIAISITGAAGILNKGTKKNDRSVKFHVHQSVMLQAQSHPEVPQKHHTSQRNPPGSVREQLYLCTQSVILASCYGDRHKEGIMQPWQYQRQMSHSEEFSLVALLLTRTQIYAHPAK